MDYEKGEIPAFDRGKKLIVFCSHRHPDHFNPEIFTRFRDYPQVEYVLSQDIPLNPGYRKKYGIDERQVGQITTVKANQEYVLDGGIRLRTLKSTDCGVAFLLNYEGKCIYHAGDLNWWHWEGEDKQYNRNMAANFKREMEKLRGIHIDVACVPLDPRLGDAYWWGLDWLVKTADVDQIYPMHFGDEPQVVERFLQEAVSEAYREKIRR
jgi:L-ascorbate metabolism protein UlaG (beta-lactamase superfamily)